MNKACLQIGYLITLIHHLVAQNGYNYPAPDNADPTVVTTTVYANQQGLLDTISNEYHRSTATYPEKRPTNIFPVRKTNGKENGKVNGNSLLESPNTLYSPANRSNFQSKTTQSYSERNFPQNGFSAPQQPFLPSGLYEMERPVSNGLSKHQSQDQFQTNSGYQNSPNFAKEDSQSSLDFQNEPQILEDNFERPGEGDYSAIPGEPEKDYPIFSYVPTTSFKCDQQQFPGYYADIGTRCQIFHICTNNRTYDFMCPNGTIFHQKYLVCVWWNQFDCDSAQNLFEVNKNLLDYAFTEREQIVTEAPEKQENGQHLKNNGFSGSKQTNFQQPGSNRLLNGYHTDQNQKEFNHKNILSSDTDKFHDNGRGLLTAVSSKQPLTAYSSESGLDSSTSEDEDKRLLINGRLQPKNYQNRAHTNGKSQTSPSSQIYSKVSEQKINVVPRPTSYSTSNLRSEIDWNQDYFGVKPQTNGFVHPKNGQPADHNQFSKESEDTNLNSEQPISSTTIAPRYRFTEHNLQELEQVYQSVRPSKPFTLPYQYPNREYLPPYSK